MANNTLPIIFILLSIIATMLATSATARHIISLPDSSSSSSSDPHPEWLRNLNLGEEEKFTKLHFYIHDFVSGENQSVYNIAESSITAHSASWFGRVQVADHLITTGPELHSEKVGRVQGIHVMADLHVAALGANWNFVFNDGSTITVVGRLVALAKEGELSIVGGTGRYRMARGVALKRTLVMDMETYNSIMEYTLYVYSSPKPAVEMLF